MARARVSVPSTLAPSIPRRSERAIVWSEDAGRDALQAYVDLHKRALQVARRLLDWPKDRGGERAITHQWYEGRQAEETEAVRPAKTSLVGRQGSGEGVLCAATIKIGGVKANSPLQRKPISVRGRYPARLKARSAPSGRRSTGQGYVKCLRTFTALEISALAVTCNKADLRTNPASLGPFFQYQAIKYRPDSQLLKTRSRKSRKNITSV